MVRKLAENIREISAAHNNSAITLGHCGQTYRNTRVKAVRFSFFLMHRLSRFSQLNKTQNRNRFGPFCQECFGLLPVGIHAVVVALVLPGNNMVEPVGTGQIPVNSLQDAVFKAD